MAGNDGSGGALRSLGARWLDIGVETPYKAWRRVPRDMRADVVHLARLHQPHGISIVRRIAAEYAASVLTVPPRRAYVVNTALYTVAYSGAYIGMEALRGYSPLLFAWLVPVGAIVKTAQVVFIRRRAALILRANALDANEATIGTPPAEPTQALVATQ